MVFFDTKAYFKKFNDLLMLRDLTYNTIKSYNSMLHCYLNWVFSYQKSPEDISFAEIRAYLMFLKQSKALSNRTINAHISQLRFFYLYVLRKPWDKYEVPYMKFNTKLPDILSLDEVNHFISTIPNLKHKACIALLYSSGLRVSEMRHLRYDDISRKDMRIYIRPSKSRSDRYAILSKRALAILTEYWFSFGKPKGWLFPGTKANSPIVSFTVSRFIADHCRFLGWNKKITAHTLRHSFGTHLYEQGYDLLTIQKLLGHKSASSSLVYVHLGAKTMKSLKSPFDDGSYL
ncbi:MAG: tyrosine-type recombinase/integrase [Candidatus Phytoplasma sp.]|jgi:integrase/recombinase XerD|nr:tyrosine-type recombinase/integrase [Phytoplasma sp.]